MPENIFVDGRLTGADMLPAGIETLAEIEPPVTGIAGIAGAAIVGIIGAAIVGIAGAAIVGMLGAT
jgi:hypothetical protein